MYHFSYLHPRFLADLSHLGSKSPDDNYSIDTNWYCFFIDFCNAMTMIK